MGHAHTCVCPTAHLLRSPTYTPIGLRCAACSPPPPSPPPGPILLLDAANITNSDVTNNVWPDLSGQGNDFTMNGVVFNGSDVGGSIGFAGTNTSYLQDSHSLNSEPMQPAPSLSAGFTGDTEAQRAHASV